MKTILILEDNDERIAGFQTVVSKLNGYELKIWRDAPTMAAECESFFANAALISLDHDLNPQPGVTTDPGTGLDVARRLAEFRPVCPVIIHSTNADRAWSMFNELRFAGWIVERVGPIGDDWIDTLWLNKARQFLTDQPNTWPAKLPPDHIKRIVRMQLALDGAGLGDALGEMLSYRSENAMHRIIEDDLPGGPWFHTDDTEMAISIFATLKSLGYLHQDDLSHRFARRFDRDPDRGYGKMTRIQLREINAGGKWKELAGNAFGGQGSMGNGGAMRVAPLGAYFADDLAECVKAARDSAVITHTHPEGVAGTIAVAVAAAMAWRLRDRTQAGFAAEFFKEILQHTPEGKVRRGIQLASQTPPEVSFQDVARTLGNGALVTAPDTVPFCIWMAAHHAHQFDQAMGRTISVGGDCDTNGAIVGGIVALSAGRESIPVEWLKAREAIQL